MKVLKYLGIGIGCIIALLLIIGLFLPKNGHVERSISINASAETIMPQLRNLKEVNSWSPWLEVDPNAKLEYSATDGEVGSYSAWDSENNDVGKGKQTIAAISDSRVDLKLEFEKPMKSQTTAYFEMKPDSAGGTKVTWAMELNSPYPFNVMCLFVDMDKMLGDEFTKGLVKLKARCESMPAAPGAAAYNIEEIDWEGKTYVTKRSTVSFDGISKFYGENFGAIIGAVGQEKMTGAPCGIFYAWNEKEGNADMAAAIPVGDAKVQAKGFETVSVPAGKALRVVYYGAYDKSEAAHIAIDKYMQEKGMELNTHVIEEYVTDPGQEPDTAKWQTNIYYMIK